MIKKEEKTEAQEIQESIDKKLNQVTNPLQKLFSECLTSVINRRTNSVSINLHEVKKPDNFVQKIPEAAMIRNKRSSVFSKVNIDDIDMS